MVGNQKSPCSRQTRSKPKDAIELDLIVKVDELRYSMYIKWKEEVNTFTCVGLATRY
ncbi:hypothetical protein RSAG8_08684, partial [Rhizoctonia solani AG-8 WAC10335]